jgi:hypothetical protein
MLRRKFAAIKLWPGVKAAEDEVIERLKIAARALDLECLAVDSHARLIDPPHRQLTREDVDFVLSLHFEAPKQFDIFSFVTLWNPLEFYHEWGYRKFTRHLLTHDDFLSCGSLSGDDHVLRSLSRCGERNGPLFRFYPTLSEPILEPTLGERRLFYVGINWERLSQRPGRHDALLTLLDNSGDLRIYGPEIYNGVKVWSGFKSYVGPIPFDGVTVVRRIHEAGISLVLSSKAHCEAEMASSRIFESAAAGAVIISNENPFTRRHFGDSLLYVDTSLPAQETCRQVQAHLEWIKSEPEKALQVARRAQEIFRAQFRLDTCLERIYHGLESRKAMLECTYTPKERQQKICLVFLAPDFRADVVEQHIASFESQRNVAARGILALDSRDAQLLGPRGLRSRVSEAPLEIAALEFTERRPDGSARTRRPMGRILAEAIRSLVQEDEVYVCVVAPNERLFSDHLSSLLRTLQDVPEAGCAWCDMLQDRVENDRLRSVLCEDPDADALVGGAPIGFGRFLFRTSAFEERLYTGLPYLDALAMPLLFGSSKSAPTRRCTLAAGDAKADDGVLPAGLEREILIDMLPQLAPRRDPVKPQSAEPSQQDLQKLAVELAHAIPFPAILKKLVFGGYRLWLRAGGKSTGTEQG